MARRMWTVKVEDFRPLDFQSGKRLALVSGEMKQCQCCGKKMSKGHWLNTGHLVGSDCAMSLEILSTNPKTRTDPKEAAFFRVTPKQTAFFLSNTTD